MNRKNILIVDRDKEFMLELREGLLPYSSSYQTAFAASLAKARELIDKFIVHLVLVNVRLAGESGIDLLLHIRRWRPDVQVVLYGRDLSEELRRAAYHSGAAAVLEQPFRMEELLRVLGHVFAKDSGSAFFDSVHLADLLQLIGMGHHSADVMVLDGCRQRGIIRIRQGNLIEAEAADKRGVEAVAEMLSWKEPTIKTSKGSAGIVSSSAPIALRDVLMQAVARLDEQTAIGS
jgi:CheY-like chemotaxis protein